MARPTYYPTVLQRCVRGINEATLHKSEASQSLFNLSLALFWRVQPHSIANECL
jgi:hypothetical protein